jgi:hypothetical protein
LNIQDYKLMGFFVGQFVVVGYLILKSHVKALRRIEAEDLVSTFALQGKGGDCFKKKINGSIPKKRPQNLKT